MDAGKQRPEFGMGFWVSILLSLFVTFSLSTSHAAERPGAGPLEKVTLAYSSLSGNQAPLWAAYEGGFFRKYGLDAQLIFISSGSRVVQAMMSGDLPIAQVAGPAVLQSNLQGGDAVMIAGAVNTLAFEFFVDRKITKPDQLKGNVVAVTRIGSSTDFAMRFALERYGLEPDKDVTIVQLETMPAMLTALEGGKIQGAMLSSPTNLRAKKLGLPVLADLQMLGLEYQAAGLATTRSFIKSRPDLVRNVMKAYVEGIHYYKTHRKEALAILKKYLKIEDAEVLADSYENIGLSLIPEKPYPTLRGIQIILRELAVKDPKAKSAKPEQFVDTSFMKELDSSGFIDGLYKASAVVAKREEPRPAAGKEKVVASKPTPPAQEKAKGSEQKTQLASKPTLTEEKAKAIKELAKPVPTSGSGGGSREYTIKRGDTLWRVAQEYYGDPMRWPKIFEANKESVKNPHYIYVGQKLVIPAN